MNRLVREGRVTFDGLIMSVLFDGDADPLVIDLSEQGELSGPLPDDGARVRVTVTQDDQDQMHLDLQPIGDTS